MHSHDVLSPLASPKKIYAVRMNNAAFKLGHA